MPLMIDHRQLLQSAGKLPPLPQSAMRLANLLADEDPNLQEIIQVIERDPALTMKLLRVANSAFGASRLEIGTVQKAVLRLGSGTVAGFVIGSSVRTLIGATIPGYNIAEADFWSHSLMTAFAADSIQTHAVKWKNSLAFTAALLHDIGKLVLGAYLDSETLMWLKRAIVEGKQAAYEAETTMLSLHHGEVGGIVAQHWGLPDVLVKGIVYHHDPEHGDDGICYATYLANLIAHQVEADAKTPQDMPPVGEALDALGLAESKLNDIGNDVRKKLKAMSGQNN